jgi:hypothetical protein
MFHFSKNKYQCKFISSLSSSSINYEYDSSYKYHKNINDYSKKQNECLIKYKKKYYPVIDDSDKENIISIENISPLKKEMSVDKTETSTSSKSRGSFDNNDDTMIISSNKKEENILNNIKGNNILNKFDITQGNNKYTINNNIFDFYAPIFVPVNHYIHNKFKRGQNTEILSVNVKISRHETVVFKLRRFDDLFQTVKLFCEIHKIKEDLIKPIIIKALEAMNNVYTMMNNKISSDDIKLLEKMKEMKTNNNNHKKGCVL